MSGAQMEAGWASLTIMAVSAGVSGIQGYRLRLAAAQTGSRILSSEGLHFSMDLLANIGVLLILLLVRCGAAPT